jgi:hypothetical protein
MQSVRLKKSLTFPRSAWCRQYSYLLNALLLAIGMLSWMASCQAQTLPSAPESKEKFDVGVGGFYQVTGAANGNFIRDDTTESGGALVSFRQPWRPWAGYEANVGYTKFYEAYNKGVVKVESNVTDFSFSYLLQSPVIYGVQPFLALGGGIIVFSPISGTLTNLNQTVPSSLPSQLLPEFTYSFGLKMPLFSHLGVNGGLRGLKYKTPDFHQVPIDTRTLRTTLQPNIGVYYRF